jgi:hypothetical protein
LPQKRLQVAFCRHPKDQRVRRCEQSRSFVSTV